MGSDEIVASHNSYTDIYEEVFPYCLSIGMTYDQFWRDDPKIASYYIRAEKLRLESKNNEMWLQGYYVYQAIGSFAEILPAFPKKGAKINPYMEKPIELDHERAERIKREKEKAHMEKMKQKMLAMAVLINKRKEEEQNGRRD